MLRLRLWKVENARVAAVVAVGRIRVELRIVKPTRETATARIEGGGAKERTSERANTKEWSGDSQVTMQIDDAVCDYGN